MSVRKPYKHIQNTVKNLSVSTSRKKSLNHYLVDNWLQFPLIQNPLYLLGVEVADSYALGEALGDQAFHAEPGV